MVPVGLYSDSDSDIREQGPIQDPRTYVRDFSGVLGCWNPGQEEPIVSHSKAKDLANFCADVAG